MKECEGKRIFQAEHAQGQGGLNCRQNCKEFNLFGASAVYFGAQGWKGSEMVHKAFTGGPHTNRKVRHREVA